MDEINITSAQYQEDFDGNNCGVNMVVDGITLSVPLDTANRQYQAILDWVAEGNTIADAD